MTEFNNIFQNKIFTKKVANIYENSSDSSIAGTVPLERRNPGLSKRSWVHRTKHVNFITKS